MATNGNLRALHEAGVSIWLDTLSRELLRSGRFAELIRDFNVTGATSNPTIFARAITSSDLYDDQLRRLTATGERDPRELFFDLALQDIADAADMLHPVYVSSGGRDGFISFECTPDLARDTDGTIEQATRLWERLARPNVMIKVPATREGLPAITELTRRGVNVNITLLFSVKRYEQVIDAYLRGLVARVEDGQPVDAIASAASLFLSRIDSHVDPQLPAGSPLRGRLALASAHSAYHRYTNRFHGPTWEKLKALGAKPQRPLWASTGTKNPDYSDVLYVAELAAPGVINTMPEQTLMAFAQHGHIAVNLDGVSGASERELLDAAAHGIDLERVANELEEEGLASFSASYQQILDRVRGLQMKAL